MKRFLMFSISVLCLAVAVLIGFHISSNKAEAQTEEIKYFFDRTSSYFTYIAITPTGDVYYHQLIDNHGMNTAPSYVGNFWGDLVSTDQSTWGGIKKP